MYSQVRLGARKMHPSRTRVQTHLSGDHTVYPLRVDADSYFCSFVLQRWVSVPGSVDIRPRRETGEQGSSLSLAVQSRNAALPDVTVR